MLCFYTGPVGSGKSLELLKQIHDLRQKGKKVLLLTSKLDTRYGKGKVTTRFGKQEDAYPIEDMVCLSLFAQEQKIEHILCDEVQFYSPEQVDDLATLVDIHNIKVSCFGLKSTFKGELFEASAKLLTLADRIVELEKPCVFCDSKALLNLKVQNGEPLYTGEAIDVGGDEKYFPVCRRHYKKGIAKEVLKKALMQAG